MCDCFLHAPHGGPALACNPGMYPDWELNRRPSGLQDSTQSTEPHQPELILFFCFIFSGARFAVSNVSLKHLSSCLLFGGPTHCNSLKVEACLALATMSSFSGTVPGT